MMQTCDRCKRPIPTNDFFAYFLDKVTNTHDGGAQCFDCRPFFLDETDKGWWHLIEVNGPGEFTGFGNARQWRTMEPYQVFINEKRKVRKDEIVTSLDGLVIAPLATIIASFDY